jgi:methylmalonyl-CoA/ethylmalonyl-CoA epimerase
VPEPSLHHTGFVVASIAESIERWRTTLSAISISETFQDDTQGARVAFLEFAPGGSTMLELVEPVTPESPTGRFLQKGGGLHHLCFEVDDLEEQIRAMKARKAMLIRHPKPAVAFEGRRIAWMVTRDKLLVEYIERKLRGGETPSGPINGLAGV